MNLEVYKSQTILIQERWALDGCISKLSKMSAWRGWTPRPNGSTTPSESHFDFRITGTELVRLLCIVVVGVRFAGREASEGSTDADIGHRYVWQHPTEPNTKNHQRHHQFRYSEHTQSILFRLQSFPGLYPEEESGRSQCHKESYAKSLALHELATSFQQELPYPYLWFLDILVSDGLKQQT